MIVENRISFLRLLKVIWKELVCILAVAVVTVSSLIYFELTDFAINQSIPSIIGTAIAIFLGFRTNSAYERWWEARKLWGAIICDSRNLVRLCSDFFGDEDPNGDHPDLIRTICFRQAAWAYILNTQLKELPLSDDLSGLLSDEDLQRVRGADDPALVLMAKQGSAVSRAHRDGLIDTRQLVLLEETISRLYEHYGGCQRIKSTVFPVHYTFFTRVFIWIFLVLLGCSLPSHETGHYTVIPAVFLIGWVFLMVEGIGNYMQDPFENNRNVVPMDAMSRMIEINLRESIGETDFPSHVSPVDGALS